MINRSDFELRLARASRRVRGHHSFDRSLGELKPPAEIAFVAVLNAARQAVLCPAHAMVDHDSVQPILSAVVMRAKVDAFTEDRKDVTGLDVEKVIDAAWESFCALGLQ